MPPPFRWLFHLQLHNVCAHVISLAQHFSQLKVSSIKLISQPTNLQALEFSHFTLKPDNRHHLSELSSLTQLTSVTINDSSGDARTVFTLSIARALSTHAQLRELTVHLGYETVHLGYESTCLVTAAQLFACKAALSCLQLSKLDMHHVTLTQAGWSALCSMPRLREAAVWGVVGLSQCPAAKPISGADPHHEDSCLDLIVVAYSPLHRLQLPLPGRILRLRHEAVEGNTAFSKLVSNPAANLGQAGPRALEWRAPCWKEALGTASTTSTSLGGCWKSSSLVHSRPPQRLQGVLQNSPCCLLPCHMYSR